MISLCNDLLISIYIKAPHKVYIRVCKRWHDVITTHIMNTVHDEPNYIEQWLRLPPMVYHKLKFRKQILLPNIVLPWLDSSHDYARFRFKIPWEDIVNYTHSNKKRLYWLFKHAHKWNVPNSCKEYFIKLYGRYYQYQEHINNILNIKSKEPCTYVWTKIELQDMKDIVRCDWHKARVTLRT